MKFGNKLEKHNTPEDAWIVVKGYVFDISRYIGSHPGGTVILEGLGQDATELFGKIIR